MIKKSLGKAKNLWVGTTLLLFLLISSLSAPWLTDYDPLVPDMMAPEIPPGEEGHLLGTDGQGFDVASRLFYGGRLTLQTAFLAITLALIIGLPLGAFSGYTGGRLDKILTGFTNILLAFPALLTAICVVSVLGKSLGNLLIAVTLVEIPRIARQARVAFMVERSKDYLLASEALGANRWRQIFKTLLPNCFAPILVVASMGMAGAVLEVAGLSYLGLGPEPGTPEWGLMIAEAQDYLEIAPWAVIFPGVAISLTVLAFNLIGDGLQDAFNPASNR